ncbi:ABC transporter substrate-binding protein [Cohnella fermenti]|nr:extracellular solute-binding protein [Cohnella fermenti]
MNMKSAKLSIAALLAIVLLAGCGSGNTNKQGAAGSDSGSGASASPAAASGSAAASAEPASYKKLGDEPLTLTFYSTSGTFPDVEFNTLIADPIHAKYPNVTIERITPAANTTNEEVLSTYTPDIIYSSSSSHANIIRTGVYEDLRPYIEKFGFDTSRIKPILWNYAQELTKGKGDQIWIIPFNANQHVLYYNKDIFDKFGVPYPTDEQQTWDDVIEIAKKLTRTVNGVHYVGLAVDNLSGLAKGLGLSITDRTEGNSTLSSDPGWLRTFELQKKILEIPGYVGPDNFWNYGRDQFMKDQTIAMRASWLANMVGPLEELRQQGVEFNWDIAPVPNFEDQLGVTREAQVHSLSINKNSPHKDEAFQVIAEILSDEGQLILSRNGRVPAVVNPALEAEYGTEIPVLQGKKVQNVFVGEPLQEHYTSAYDLGVSSALTDAAEGLAIGGLDVNTALRNAEEAINQKAESLRSTLGAP